MGWTDLRLALPSDTAVSKIIMAFPQTSHSKYVCLKSVAHKHLLSQEVFFPKYILRLSEAIEKSGKY